MRQKRRVDRSSPADGAGSAANQAGNGAWDRLTRLNKCFTILSRRPRHRHEASFPLKNDIYFFLKVRSELSHRTAIGLPDFGAIVVTIGEGSRNTHIASLAGSMRQQGLEFEAILSVALKSTAAARAADEAHRLALLIPPILPCRHTSYALLTC